MTVVRVEDRWPLSVSFRPRSVAGSICRPISLSSYENTILPALSKNCVATTL